MSFLDKARGKLTEAVDKHGDKITQGIDKAAHEANKRTGGKHGDKIQKATTKAKDALEKLDKKDDGDLGTGTPGGTAR
jgi:uncharacterized protein YjbJ (UPF0337 family)